MKCCIAICFRVFLVGIITKKRGEFHESREEGNQYTDRKKVANRQRKSGYTQEVFAETLDVGVEHYRKIESGVYGLQPEKMLVLYEKYRIEPTYLVTGDTNHKVDIELFLANCSREERDAFIDRMLAYMRS